MWNLTEGDTVVGVEGRILVRLPSFGPRLALADPAARDCVLRVGNVLGSRIAFRLQHTNGVRKIMHVGFIESRTMATLDVKPGRHELIFCYANLAGQAAEAETARHFWKIMDDNKATRFCFRRRFKVAEVHDVGRIVRGNIVLGRSMRVPVQILNLGFDDAAVCVSGGEGELEEANGGEDGRAADLPCEDEAKPSVEEGGEGNGQDMRERDPENEKRVRNMLAQLGPKPRLNRGADTVDEQAASRVEDVLPEQDKRMSLERHKRGKRAMNTLKDQVKSVTEKPSEIESAGKESRSGGLLSKKNARDANVGERAKRAKERRVWFLDQKQKKAGSSNKPTTL